MDAWMDGCMDGCTDERMDKWMDGSMHGWMDGRTEGWMVGCTSEQAYTRVQADLGAAGEGEVGETSEAVQQGHALVPHPRTAQQGQVAQACQAAQLLQAACGDCTAVRQNQLLQPLEGCNALQRLHLTESLQGLTDKSVVHACHRVRGNRHGKPAWVIWR